MSNRTQDRRAAEAFAVELRKWWSFDDRQWHTHTWHSREDFIRDKLPELLSAALQKAREEERERCAKVADDETECEDGEIYIARMIAKRIRALHAPS